MANLKALAKDTAIYGLSSIVGRFLNYLLVPLYTHVISAENGGYGVVTNLYAYVALLLVLLTFGMETTFFRFANKEGEAPDTVFSTSLALIASLACVFLAGIFGFITPVSELLGYAEHPEYIMVMASVVALDALQAIPFSYLRYKKQAIKFASLKLLFIVLNIGLNLLYFVWLCKSDVLYVFTLNLVCTGIITFFFLPEMLKIKWKVDFSLLRRMLSYSWPILILGIAGILNQAADKMIFPLIYPDRAQGVVELGVYGACVKVAMIMAMITQAFRYAYEPFVFAQSKDKDKNETYAIGMKYFLIFTLLAFLCVVAYLPLLKYMVGSDYWEGLKVIPIVMAAEIMMGIYFNLSFWYNRQDHLRSMVLTGWLCRTVCRKHYLYTQIQLHGMRLGWICRLWYCHGAQLHRWSKDEPHQLSHEKHGGLRGHYLPFLRHHADSATGMAGNAENGNKHPPGHCLRGAHHIPRPAPAQLARSGKVFQVEREGAFRESIRYREKGCAG